MKTGRIPTSWRHLNAGFVSFVGVLVILIYLVVSQQFAVSTSYVVILKAQGGTELEEIVKAPAANGEQQVARKQGKVACSSEGDFSESCEVDGDVRVNGTALSVTVVVLPANQSDEPREWRIRPNSQRSLDNIRKATVAQVQDRAAAPPCTVTYDVPAVLFALGGHSGKSFFHDYSDVLVPLFAASRRYDGEVQFLVSNVVDPWWPEKYSALLRRLSKYDAVHVDGDDASQVRCFPHVTVGLHIHRLLNIVPEPPAPGPGGRRLTIADFTRFQREAFALRRGAVTTTGSDKKPRLLLLQRVRYRRFVNLEEVVRAAEAAGFETVVADMRGDTSLAEQAQMVNSFDAMLGVHGAGLTNAMFLPPGAVQIQVVPYGKMEIIARWEYGEPMVDMGLTYLEYNVTAEESTLPEVLGPDHPAIRDPDSIHRSGWDQVNELYLKKQDVRINVTRFAPTLAQAFQHLRQQQQR